MIYIHLNNYWETRRILLKFYRNNKEEVEKAFQLRLYEAMEQYEKLWKKNLERIGTDIMEQMRRNGEKDPKKIISDEILAVKEAYERGEIKIVRVDFYNDKIIQEWFRSPYQVGDARVEPPKYATVLVNKHELDEMVKKYGKDPNKITMVSVFELEDIKTRSGMTLYDSMLVGGVWRWKGYLLDIEDIFTVRALKNIEKWYNKQVWKGLGDFERLRSEALLLNNSGWEQTMYKEVPNFMELQIFWKIWPPKKYYTSTDGEIKNVFNK